MVSSCNHVACLYVRAVKAGGVDAVCLSVCVFVCHVQSATVTCMVRTASRVINRLASATVDPRSTASRATSASQTSTTTPSVKVTFLVSRPPQATRLMCLPTTCTFSIGLCVYTWIVRISGALSSLGSIQGAQCSAYTGCPKSSPI